MSTDCPWGEGSTVSTFWKKRFLFEMQCLVILCVLVKISLTFLTNFVAKITSRFAGKRISFEDISETQESRLNVKCHDRRFCKNSSNLPVSLG